MTQDTNSVIELLAGRAHRDGEEFTRWYDHTTPIIIAKIENMPFKQWHHRGQEQQLAISVPTGNVQVNTSFSAAYRYIIYNM